MLKIYKQSYSVRYEVFTAELLKIQSFLVCYRVFTGKWLPSISKTAVTSKRLELFTDHHSETSQKTWISSAYSVFHTKIILQLLSPQSVFGMAVQ